MNNILRLKLVMVLLCTLFATVVAAQSGNKITGQVTDEAGKPFIGVTVMAPGTTVGTSTDVKGEYSITVKKGASLAFSFIGYKNIVVPVGASSKVNVKMEPDMTALDEIVVTGYGFSKKGDITGSVSSISTKNLKDFKTGSVVEALGGQVAGVQITQMDGSPGSGFDIKIRGIGSMNGSTGPMFVVDGFQVDNIDYLSNQDIESMEVLKDASAAAIYGARAANGVVLVTTKSGTVGRPVVSYSGSANYRNISKRLEVLDPYEFVKLQMEIAPTKFDEVYYKTGNDPKTGEPYRYQSVDDYIGQGGVKWQNEIFKPTWSQDHNISVQGGSDATKYNIGASRYSENGLFNNSSYEKTTAKLRLTQKLSKKITIDFTINYVNTNRSGVSTSADGGRFNMLGQIISARPTAGLKMTDDELLNAPIDPLLEEDSSSSLAQVNPIVQTESVINSKRVDLWQGNGSFTWQILKDLQFKTAATYRMENTRSDLFYQEKSSQAYRNGHKPFGETTMARSLSWTNYNYLTYSKKIKKHSGSIMVGQEMNFRNDENLRGEAMDFPFDFLANDNLGIGALPSVVSTGYGEKTLISFFGRLNYNYDNRYLLTATFRTDGSSVFSPKRKWAGAPSFSAAWRISEEKFMKPLSSVISNMKIRAGWGILGNDRIPNYLSLALYTANKYGIGSSGNTVLVPKHKPNPDLKWEGSMTTNLGIDLGFFNNRLNVNVDMYIKDTKDLLMLKSLPYVSGFSSQWQNIGSIRNKGLEINLNSINLTTKGFTWSTDFNISFVKNTLEKLQPGENYMLTSTGFNSDFKDADYIAMLGQSLGQMYGYQWDGVYQSSDFNVNAVTGAYELKEGIAKNTLIAGGNPKPGDLKLKDTTGDGLVNTKDRGVIGNGTPKFYGGFTNNFAYKGFDLGVIFQFQYGNDIYNATRLFATTSDTERSNKLAEVKDRWTPENASNDVPAAKGIIRNMLYSRFIEDGSFLRLKNVTLGYSLPSSLLKKIYISKIRIYVSAQNLFVTGNYSGFDPEVSVRASNPMTPSMDWGAYPRSKVWTFGLDIQF